MPEVRTERRDPSAAELINQIERRSREIDSARFEQPRTGRWRMVLLAIGIVSSSAFLAWDLSHRTEPPPPFDAAAVQAGLEFTVYVTASGLEGHRERTGAFPATLEEVGLDHPSIAYTRQDDGYRLVAVAGTQRVTFEEGDSLDALQESYWALRRTGTP